jgi:hypothetical protein
MAMGTKSNRYEVAVGVALAMLVVTLTGLLLNIGFSTPVLV